MRLSRALEELAYTLPCPTCGVEPPHMCRASSGRHASRPHKARFEPIRKAYGYGFTNGRRRALNAPRKESA